MVFFARGWIINLFIMKTKDEIIYSEINEVRKMQNEEYSLLSQKHYWLMILDVGIITFLTKEEVGFCYILFFGISLIISISSLYSVKYMRSLNLDTMISSDKEDRIFLKDFNKKFIKAINKNQKGITRRANFLKVSIVFVLLGIVHLIINLI